MSDRPSIRTQFLIFTLFGEYIVPRGGGAWTAGLLNLLRVLGVSERAARSTLSRMSQKSWLRRLRSQLRTRLGWLGFGRLAPGTWVSPSDRRQEVEADLEDLGARPYAVYFSRSPLYFITNEEIVARCWDLKGLNREYARFLKKIEPAHDEARSGLRSGQPLAPAECFRRGVWLAFGSSQF